MGDERRPEKQQVIDALVLAFSYSRAAKLVGTDALRSVISVEYHDIVRDNAFDLQPVWELLEGQPGFEPEAVTAPLAMFKSWEDRLGLQVKLPAAMAGLSDKELALAVNQGRVPPAELKALFPDKQEVARRVEPRKPAGGDEAGKARAPRKRRPRWLGVVAGVIGALTLGYASFTLYRACNPAPAQWEAATVDVKKFLPGAANVERLGSQLSLRMPPAWLARPEEERRVALRDALTSMVDGGVKVLIIRDSSGAIRATAQQARDGQIHVTFKR